MARKRREEPTANVSHYGGVTITDSDVAAGGSIVGGDMITLSGEDEKRLDVLFRDLVTAVNANPIINDAQRTEVLKKSTQLQAELKKPEPDLGTLASIKQFLASQGAGIATAAAAIFQYPPVQNTLKILTERLLGA